MHKRKYKFILRTIGIGIALVLFHAHIVVAEKYSAPIEVLEAARAASSAKDDERVLNCLTPESFAILAVAAVPSATATRNELIKRGDVDGLKAIDDAFRKHRLTYDACEQSLQRVVNASPIDQATLSTAWLKQIDHKPRFIHDLDRARMQCESDDASSRTVTMIDTLISSSPLHGELLEMKVDRSTAKAILRRSIRGEERLFTLQFRKQDDGWLIHIPQDFRLAPERLVREGYESPEQAYAFCRAELRARNHREFAACLTEQSLRRVTAKMVHLIYGGKRARVVRRRGDDIALLTIESAYAPFDSILRHHGIGNESITALSENVLEEADVSSILDAITDKPALFADLCELQIKAAGVDFGDIHKLLDGLLASELGNMKRGITEQGEEWAKGTIKATVEGQEGHLPMMFEKHATGWLVYIPL